jgi:myo-inositol-1(or 4)-monophosphatase
VQPAVNIALRAARRAGQIIVQALDRLDRVHVDEKSAADLVTSIDRRAEREIAEILADAYPRHGIIAEEGGTLRASESGASWLVDPLDGTTNFVHGIPHFAVSIALVEGHRVTHGVVFDPIRNEVFAASRGYGAQLNDRRIRVSTCEELANAVIGTGIPYGDKVVDLAAHGAIVADLAPRCRGVRRFGSAALDLCYVAAARYDGYFEMRLKPWDMAAGALIVEEAGGLISDLRGHPDCLAAGEVLCGNRRIYRELLRCVQPHLRLRPQLPPPGPPAQGSAPAAHA